MKEFIKNHKKTVIISGSCSVVVIAVVVALCILQPWASVSSAAAAAKVSESQALKIAQEKVSGAWFRVEDADKEDGTVVYELEGIDESGNVHELEIDGNTGTVLSEEIDMEDSDEEAEMTAEQKAQAQKALAAAQAYAPDYRFTNKGLDDEDKNAAFELEGINQQGQKIELSVNASTGKISHVEKE